jgi:hypothetical protein
MTRRVLAALTGAVLLAGCGQSQPGSPVSKDAAPVQEGRAGAPPASAAPAPSKEQGMATPMAPEELRTATGVVRGQTTWPGLKDQTFDIVVVLVGNEERLRNRYLSVSTTLGGAFSFPKVPEGRYRLHAGTKFTRLWELPVEVPAAPDVVLDLGPDQSQLPPSEFPPRD